MGRILKRKSTREVEQPDVRAHEKRSQLCHSTYRFSALGPPPLEVEAESPLDVGTTWAITWSHHLADPQVLGRPLVLGRAW